MSEEPPHSPPQRLDRFTLPPAVHEGSAPPHPCHTCEVRVPCNFAKNLVFSSDWVQCDVCTCLSCHACRLSCPNPRPPTCFWYPTPRLRGDVFTSEDAFISPGYIFLNSYIVTVSLVNIRLGTFVYTWRVYSAWTYYTLSLSGLFLTIYFLLASFSSFYFWGCLFGKKKSFFPVFCIHLFLELQFAGSHYVVIVMVTLGLECW